MKTAALDGALLVFHPGSGATVALTDDLLWLFTAIEQAGTGLSPSIADIDADILDNCLRLLRQQQLIQAVTP